FFRARAVRSGAVVRRRGRRSEFGQFRLDDQSRTQRDVARPVSLVEPRDRVRLHADSRACGESLRRCRARGVRSTCAHLQVAARGCATAASRAGAGCASTAGHHRRSGARMTTMLAITGLHTELDTDSGVVRAIEALDLTIERGETFALVGESGCGKSMTALSILRLLPDAGRVSAGRVDMDGTDVTQLPEARMRHVYGALARIIIQDAPAQLKPALA